MSGSVRVLVTGAKGRMGQEVVRAVTGAQDMEIVAQADQGDDLRAILRDARPDVMVDFTVPEAVKENIRAALEAKVVPIVGTTGMGPDDVAEVRSLCEQHDTAALIAPNFAIGAVLLMRFAVEAARYLPDVEIIEMHHERKVDAPSGTAAKTAEMIAAAAERPPVGDAAGAFEKYPGARGGKAPGDIRIHSVRLPGFVASQEVIFGGPGQRLSLRHDSIDRASFMPGVLLAIRKAPTLTGLVYGLENLL
jgi:4-hydroxy-tetrahydrodipicolinate reductase